MSLLRQGDQIVVVDRKHFRDDNTLIFVGVVEDYADRAVRARGLQFHVSPYEVAGSEKPSEERVRLFSLDGDNATYLLPKTVEIARLQLRRSPKSLVLTDGSAAILDMSDWLLRG
ncbi:MAG: hypothetical protein M1336_00310 [Deltaproteobacteria bacterium]|jgi:hypothetical protein|nr:hypothetical protein [Deltaproteobacteria bacterium]